VGRFKIDENVPIEAAELFVQAGHDCHTLYDESLAGAPDPMVVDACAREARVLVTLDLDFSDVRAFSPGSYPGIVVLRPHVPDRERTLELVRRLLTLLVSEPVSGCLWIVDSERLRVRSPLGTGDQDAS